MRWDALRTRFSVFAPRRDAAEPRHDPGFRLGMCLLGRNVMSDRGFQTLQLATPSEVSEFNLIEGVVADPSTLPIHTFPDKVLLPGEVFDCTVREDHPFYQSVEK